MDLKIEICENWIWKADQNYQKKSFKTLTMDEIRNFYKCTKASERDKWFLLKTNA